MYFTSFPLQPEIFLVWQVRKFSSSAASVVIKHFNHINKERFNFLIHTNINTAYNLSQGPCKSNQLMSQRLILIKFKYGNRDSNLVPSARELAFLYDSFIPEVQGERAHVFIISLFPVFSYYFTFSNTSDSNCCEMHIKQ